MEIIISTECETQGKIVDINISNSLHEIDLINKLQYHLERMEEIIKEYLNPEIKT